MTITPCRIDPPANGRAWCHDCEMVHAGHTIALSQELTEKGQKWREAKHRKNQPGIVQRVVNYTKATIKYHRKHGYKLPLYITQDRTAICHSNACGQYDITLDRCQHRKCGCTISEKVTWSTEQCPKAHWLAVFGPVPPRTTDSTTVPNPPSPQC